MSGRDEFAAMIAAPEDDAPRLVWADGRLEAGDPHSLQDVGVVLDAAPQLAVLALAGNRLGGSLSAFLDARAPIDVVDLQECDLGDDDVTALVASPVWQRLGVLDLRSNRLGPAAAKTIADAPARLRTLYIGGNALGPEGKAAVKTLPARVHA